MIKIIIKDQLNRPAETRDFLSKNDALVCMIELLQTQFDFLPATQAITYRVERIEP